MSDHIYQMLRRSAGALFILSGVCGIGLAATTNVTEDIRNNTVWNVANSPYIISGEIRVRSGAELTIDPGVEIRFNAAAVLSIANTSLASETGSIRAIGTEEQPILFTSNQPSPSPGDWGGLVLSRRTVGPATTFEHCVFEYGGGSRSAFIEITRSSPSFRRCTIRNSNSNGISILSSGSGTDRAAPSILSSLFLGNRLSGLVIDGESNDSVIRDNLFEGNLSHPVMILSADSIGTLRGNTFKSNTPNAIQVTGDRITKTQTVASMGVPFEIVGNRIDIISAGLIIDPGVVLEFTTGTGIFLDRFDGGFLQAVGEASNPILFTSHLEQPLPGDWIGLVLDFPDGPTPTQLQFCIIEYAGQGGLGAVTMNSTSPTIRNCSIRNNLSDAILVVGPSSPTISQNNLHDNGGFDLNNGSANQVVARNNWWGSAAGPQAINGDVDASNFLLSPVPLGFPRSPFTLFFPHFAAGDGWRSLISLNNIESVDTVANLAFRDDSGNPVVVSIGGTSAVEFDIAVPAQGTAILEVSAAQLRTGSVTVEPQQKVLVAEVFQFLANGQVSSSAGVPSSPIGRDFLIPVNNDGSVAASVAVAVSNPNSLSTEVHFELYDAAGAKRSETSRNLAAGGHVALFVSELFQQAGTWTGNLRVKDDLGVVVVPLRVDGTLISTVPATRLQR